MKIYHKKNFSEGTLLTGLGLLLLVTMLLRQSFHPKSVLICTAALLLGLGGLMGSYLGARCQRFVPARRIKWGLALILLFTSLRYLWQGL